MSVISNEGDRLPVPSGARIIAGYVGSYPVFKSDIQGSVYKYEIETTNEEVRLINFIGGKSNDWEGVETDIYVDWGDGTTYLEYGERFNTEKYNRDSKWKLTHQYQSSGEKHTILIKSVEPLIPVGCKVVKILGTWPEDYYVASELGLFAYNEDMLNERPLLSSVTSHKSTVTTLGAELLNLWKNTKNCIRIFQNWTVLNNIPADFFKANILNECRSFFATFDGCASLSTHDLNLIGETNNVVEDTSYMFRGVPVNTTLNFRSSSSLIKSEFMYQNSNVVNTQDGFFSNMPALQSALSMFMGSDIKDHSDDMLLMCSNLTNAASLFETSPISNAKIDTTNWRKISDIRRLYFNTNIRSIKDDLFGGNFASDTKDLSLNMDSFMANITTGNIPLKKNMFSALRNKNKLQKVNTSWFENSKIVSIPTGLFESMFTGLNDYRLDSVFKNVTSDNPISVPQIYNGNLGLVDIRSNFFGVELYDMDRGIFNQLTNLTSVISLFESSKINFKFYEDFFKTNVKISSWNRMFNNMVYKYGDYFSIDYFIYSEIDEIDCSGLFYGANLKVRKIFNPASTVKSVNVTNLTNTTVFNKNWIVDNRSMTGDWNANDEIFPIKIWVYSSGANATEIRYNDKASVQDTMSASIDWGDGNGYIAFNIPAGVSQSTVLTSKTLSKGVHVIKIKSPVDVYITNGEVIKVDGDSNITIDTNAVSLFNGNTYINTKYWGRYTREFDTNLSIINSLSGYRHPRMLKYANITDDLGYNQLDKLGLVEIHVELDDVTDIRIDSMTGSSQQVIAEIINENGLVSRFEIQTGAIINVPRGENLIRITSPNFVWFGTHRDKIVGVYGELPAMNMTQTFYSLAPNLKRIGENILCNLVNTSFARLFKGLSNLEFIPETLIHHNHNVIDYTEMFADCVKLFKIPDYFINNKSVDINCTAMFSGCTNVKYVYKPICNSVDYKITATDMFKGVKTRMWYNKTNEEVFADLWIVGDTGLGRHTDYSVTHDWDNILAVDGTNISEFSLSVAQHVTPWETLVTQPHENIKFCGQAIGKYMRFDAKTVNASDLSMYWTFLEHLENIRVNETVNYNVSISNNKMLFYNERLATSIKWKNANLSTLSPWYLMHNYNLSNLSESFYKTNLADSQKMQWTLPYIASKVSNVYRMYRECSVSNADLDDFNIPTNIISNASECFMLANFQAPESTFKNMNESSGTNINIDNMFNGNKSQVIDPKVFEQIGSKLKPEIVGVFEDSGLIEATDTYTGCEHLTKLSRIYLNAKKFIQLPRINHLNNLRDLTYFAAQTALLDIPENYIKVTHHEDMFIDYMFSECGAMLFEKIFIDPSSQMKSLSIDYSLENVLTTIGEDPEIFKGLPYDSEYEHRSRVIFLDERNTFVQEIQTLIDNKEVKIHSVQFDDLNGHNLDGNTFVAVWGDDTKSSIVRGGSLSTPDITHTYQTAGTYSVKLMLKNATGYVKTIESGESELRTTRILGNFKFGTAKAIADLQMVNMFGTYVTSVTNDLFNNLSDVSTLTSFPYMFYKFKSLTDFPVGILDCFVNLTSLERFAYETKGRVSTTAKVGLMSNLTKLTTLRLAFSRSSLTSIEDGFFSNNNASLTTLYAAFESNRLTSVPRNLLAPLINLTNAEWLLAWNDNFLLDESYRDFFKFNTKLVSLSHALTRCKIKSIPLMFNGLTNLQNISQIFASQQSVYTPWNDNPEYSPNPTPKDDGVDFDLPEGLFDTNVSLLRVDGLVSGRPRCKSYPATLLHNNSKLTDTRGMFYMTNIAEIHEHTINNAPEAGTLDARYMFAETYVRNCPKPIGTIAKTVKTEHMLDKVSGFMTEVELFTGVTTNPSDIQSGYRQEFNWFNIDVTTSDESNIYLHCPENVFPQNGYLYDVDWGDGEVHTFYNDVASESELNSLIKSNLPAGTRTIKIKAPFLTGVKATTGTAVITSMSGEIGKMNTTSHTVMKNTVFKDLDSVETIDYKRNSHLTSMSYAFDSMLKLTKIKTGAFDALKLVNSLAHTFSDSPKLSIQDGYKPTFNHMPLKDITYLFHGCSLLQSSTYGDYEPVKDVTSLVNCDHAFGRTNLTVTPRVKFNNVTTAFAMFIECKSLIKTYADYFNTASKCSNFGYVFKGASNLTTIEGETNSISILNVVPTVNVDYTLAFSETGLNPTQIARIVNNMGAFKSTANITSIVANQMFYNIERNKSSSLDRTLPLNMVVDGAKTVNANQMFDSSYISGVPENGVKLLNGAKLSNFSKMFNNCYADENVTYVNEVFGLPNQSPSVDYRATNLQTLNVFTLSSLTGTDISYKLSIYNGLNPERIPFVKITDGVNDRLLINVAVSDLLSLNLSGNISTFKIASTHIVVPTFTGVTSMGDLTGKFSTWSDNWVNESDNFYMGKHFGLAVSCDVRLGGSFYVLDAESNHTLNGVFKGMSKVTEYPESIFKDYTNGNDGVKNIISIKSTFEDNLSLNRIIRGQMQWLPHLQHVDKMYKNCALTEVPEGYFAQQTEITSWYEVFADNHISKLPSKLIYVRPK